MLSEDEEGLNYMLSEDEEGLNYMLSEDEEGLNYMLKAMEECCYQNELLLNTNKKCMTFNKTGRLIRKIFTFNNIQLETVRSYKYLGFLKPHQVKSTLA